ncbi:MAG: site-specific DNA-methyltransferase [Bdellovibrionales bacterium]|nr:site-specific DNA-methyltransferase [Bdellovibrionales bacterium]
MTKVKELLVKELGSIERYVDDESGDINWEKVKDEADSFNEELLEKLFNKKELKKHFFKKIGEAEVFDVRAFKFFVDENKIYNSYTKYKNRIGLAGQFGYIADDKKTVLNFPFKDSILEGGQTKEDEKREEIFFNSILAKDEVDRLFDKKALVNWTRYDKEGKQPVKNFSLTENDLFDENLIVRGNNLLALHSLRDVYKGRVKLIYIDPPYNREDDKSTFYNDKFNHSTWLVFMKNRLEIAKELLSSDGIVYVQCDDNEQAYLKVLMDEIFGNENFLSTIAYQRSGVAGLGQGGKFVVNVTEYINVFCKSANDFKPFDLQSSVPLEHKHMKRYNAILKSEGKRKLYKTLKSKATGEEVKIYKHSGYEIEKISLAKFGERKDEIEEIYNNNFDNIFRLNVPQDENTFQWSIIDSFDDDELYTVEYLVSRGKHKGQIIKNYYQKNQLFAWLRSSGHNEDGVLTKTNKMSDFWTNDEIPKADLANEGGVKLKRGKKPEQLLKRIISISTKEGDIVLDYHLGSGTTCAVAHKMNRKYIGIEQLNYDENDATVRLQNVIKGDSTGVSKHVDWKGGGSFVYCELAKFNEKAKEKILYTNTHANLVKIFNQMCEDYFLDYNLDVREVKKVLNEDGFKKLDLEKQKKLLLETLDLNQMYVNESEMADKKFGINKEDQRLTKEFYSK